MALLCEINGRRFFIWRGDVRWLCRQPAVGEGAAGASTMCAGRAGGQVCEVYWFWFRWKSSRLRKIYKTAANVRDAPV